MNGNDPVLYVAYDQNRLDSISYPQEMFSAFDLPNNLEDKDILKIYIWNPKKSKISFNDIKIETVAFTTEYVSGL